jgi:hypothetical protein
MDHFQPLVLSIDGRAAGIRDPALRHLPRFAPMRHVDLKKAPNKRLPQRGLAFGTPSFTRGRHKHSATGAFKGHWDYFRYFGMEMGKYSPLGLIVARESMVWHSLCLSDRNLIARGKRNMALRQVGWMVSPTSGR